MRVQALSYLLLIGLVALLKLLAGWRGMQPLDGWIMRAAYLVYAVQAILRGRTEGEQKELFAMLLIGDGVVALVQPQRYVRRWTCGPASYRRLMRLLCSDQA